MATARDHKSTVKILKRAPTDIPAAVRILLDKYFKDLNDKCYKQSCILFWSRACIFDRVRVIPQMSLNSRDFIIIIYSTE